MAPQVKKQFRAGDSVMPADMQAFRTIRAHIGADPFFPIMTVVVDWDGGRLDAPLVRVRHSKDGDEGQIYEVSADLLDYVP